MDRLYTLSLLTFLIIAGLGMVGAALPSWVRIVGGVAGIIAGLLLLIQVFG
jgi:hypothetical protein